jgi:hypothetical protein
MYIIRLGSGLEAYTISRFNSTVLKFHDFKNVPIAMVLISHCEKIYRFSVLGVPYELSQIYIVFYSHSK